MSAPHLRLAQPGEGALLSALHAACFDQGWPAADFDAAITSPSDLVVIAQAPASVPTPTPTPTKTQVQGQAQDIAGFAQFRLAGDQGELLTLCTAKALRGQGLGGQILARGEALAAKAGCEIIFLEVAIDNAPAIALYRRANYRHFANRPAYYKRAGGRVAAMLFQKKLAVDGAID